LITILLPDNFQQYFSSVVFYFRKVYYHHSIQELKVGVAAATNSSAVPCENQKVKHWNCLHWFDVHNKFRKNYLPCLGLKQRDRHKPTSLLVCKENFRAFTDPQHEMPDSEPDTT